ncbi:unnamed protein product, partial [Ectocarpus sp. 4 AP-2014]
GAKNLDTDTQLHPSQKHTSMHIIVPNKAEIVLRPFPLSRRPSSQSSPPPSSTRHHLHPPYIMCLRLSKQPRPLPSTATPSLPSLPLFPISPSYSDSLLSLRFPHLLSHLCISKSLLPLPFPHLPQATPLSHLGLESILLIPVA